MKIAFKYLVLSISVLAFLSMKSNSEKIDKASKGGILVIPFSTSMYFNDNDQFICQASNMTPGELVKHIRMGVAGSMLDKLYGNYPSDTVSEISTSKKKSDVDVLYSIANYSLEEKPLLAYYRKSTETANKNFFTKIGSRKNEPEYLNPAKPNLKKHRYFKVSFRDTATYQKVVSSYEVNYVLFIDHFEMETHFKDCVEMHGNISTRDMYVHYTLLDAKGKFKDGGVVCITYQSSTNNAQEIMKGTLPDLSGMILQEIKPSLK